MNNNITKKQDEKFCHNCGNIIKTNNQYCPECGTRQSDNSIRNTNTTNNEDTDISEKSITGTLLLLLFFGGIGAHDFYARKADFGISKIALLSIIIISGITSEEFISLPMIIFSIMLSIWLIVDFLQIVTGNFRERHNGKKIVNW
jgi:predicted RNA-binding Zn-ribbon protein involved in translation (DUF1610 family)/TM2 domain-containing membrane protein YozV